MQKLIIVRGHSGSGKSTFAELKIAEFKAAYPSAVIYHIENDKFLMQDGEYCWTPSNYKAAKQHADKALREALRFAKGNGQTDVLIVVSNVGANIKAILPLIHSAEKQHMLTEVYRMQNFFTNRHQVDQMTVYSMFIEIRNHPLEGEILVPPLQPMTEEDKQIIDRMTAFSQ